MFIADGWNDFRVLDAGNGMKLERWKGITLLRPDPQAVWLYFKIRESACSLAESLASSTSRQTAKSTLRHSWLNRA